MIVREIQAKSVLSTSKIYDYTVNPYTGCQHACSYCYARFMRRFTGHEEQWGDFVDVKINAPDLLRVEIHKKKPGKVWVSGVCDPYQPLERRYELTRRCLQVLVDSGWPVVVQTRSPLVVRDADILGQAQNLEVGITIGTADDAMRHLFEPQAPPIHARLRVLDELRKAGIRTFVMIAPLLPGAERLGGLLRDRADHVLVDRMNYAYGAWVYREHGLGAKLGEDYYRRTANHLAEKLRESGIATRVI